MAEQVEFQEIHDADGALRADFVRAVGEALEQEDARDLRRLVKDLHEADVADLIEFLPSDARVLFILKLGRSFDVEALPELDEAVRDELMEALPNQFISSAVRKLDTDDALYLIEDMDDEDQQEILSKVPKSDRTALARGLEYPEYSAGRLMQTSFVAVPAFWSVGQTIDYMRNEEDLPEDFIEIYVVDPAFHTGRRRAGQSWCCAIRARSRSRKSCASTRVVFNVTDEQDDVAYKFEQYTWCSAAVVDANNRLVGSITIDDIVDVIQDEAEEDILRLGGVGDEEITDTILSITQSRFGWLLINLATAVLASWVISLFDATIEQMVALAILMPIVASMGGNAGTQTMTVAVRALATRETCHRSTPCA